MTSRQRLDVTMTAAPGNVHVKNGGIGRTAL